MAFLGKFALRGTLGGMGLSILTVGIFLAQPLLASSSAEAAAAFVAAPPSPAAAAVAGNFQTIALNQTNSNRLPNGGCIGAFIVTGSLDTNIQFQNPVFAAGANDGNWYITPTQTGGLNGLFVRVMITNPGAGASSIYSILLSVRQAGATTFGLPQAMHC
jgi:hypothetical protein